MQPGQTMITGSPTNLLPSQGLTGKLLEHIQTLAQERDGLVAQSNEFQVQINEQQYKLEWADEVRIFVAGLADALGISDGDGARESRTTTTTTRTPAAASRGRRNSAHLLPHAPVPAVVVQPAARPPAAANGEQAPLFLLRRRSRRARGVGLLIGSPRSDGAPSAAAAKQRRRRRRRGRRPSAATSGWARTCSRRAPRGGRPSRAHDCRLNGEEGSLFRQALSVEVPWSSPRAPTSRRWRKTWRACSCSSSWTA